MKITKTQLKQLIREELKGANSHIVENMSPELLKLAKDPVLNKMWQLLQQVTRSQGMRAQKFEEFIKLIQLIKKERPDLIEHPMGQAQIYGRSEDIKK